MSDRHLSLPPWLNALLTDRRERMAGASLHVFAFYGSEVNRAKGRSNVERREDRNASRHMRWVLDSAGFPWASPHVFRKTAATRMLAAGAPLNQVADQLGHADTSMTARVYLGRSNVATAGAHTL